MIIPLRQISSDVSSVPLLDVARGNQPLKAEFLEAFSAILDSGQFIGGPFVKMLEERVAAVSDARFGIGCASGSDALLLALMALGIQPGDEVICPSFTFFATASAVVRLGATPVFADIEPSTFNLDHNQLEALITTRTKAIIPVHLFGQCCQMDPILEIARRHHVFVIEDCAQSIGASDRGRRAGGMGHIGCFSFYPTKNIGGFGDGGMLTTNDETIAQRLRLLANHGMAPRYYHQVVGINSRLDAIQAAILMIKMKQLDHYSQLRVKNADYYQQLFSRSGLDKQVVVPQAQPGSEHVWNQFSIRLKQVSRDQVRARLAEAKIGTEIYYPLPLHQQECFRSIPVRPGSLMETESAAADVLALPIFPELTKVEQEYVVDNLARVLRELEVE
jgi:dTDP-4-amino-4,6-dideoxygalactose transaminase